MRFLLTCVLVLVLSSACHVAGIKQVTRRPVQARVLPHQITIVSWNVYKGSHARLPDDLRTLIRRQQPELVFLQEAKAELLGTAPMVGYFAPSWQYPLFDETTTGVLTLSWVQATRTEAVRTRWREFFVAAPKVALVTEYPLPNGTQLLAVNVHCLNFERWGTFKLRSQLNTLKSIMAQHSGPIILAGDFNTWNHRRLSLITALANELNLIEADGFSEGLKTADRSVEVLNWLLGIDKNLALDRVYYRGLSQLSVTVLPYTSSDHTALQVTFTVEGTNAEQTRVAF